MREGEKIAAPLPYKQVRLYMLLRKLAFLTVRGIGDCRPDKEHRDFAPRNDNLQDFDGG